MWVSGDERHGLIFDVVNDGRVILSSDERVKCNYHTGFSSLGLLGYQTAFRECYDAGCNEAGFEKEDYDDTDCGRSYIKKYDDYMLVPQPVKPLVVYNKKPIIIERKGNKLFVDFGQEMVGYLTFNAQGKKGSKITLHFSEELNDDGTVRFQLRFNFFMGAFMLFALQKEGERELLYNIITDERAWLNMLKEGATTTFEAWGKEQKWNTSLFHPVGAIPLIFINDIN